MPKYIVETTKPDGTTTVKLHSNRPKQTDIKAEGLGRYVFRSAADGRVLRDQAVVLNTKGNLKIEVRTPTQLQTLSGPQLNRLHRYYSTQIVKLWPEKVADLRKIEAEKSHRENLTVTTDPAQIDKLDKIEVETATLGQELLELARDTGRNDLVEELAKVGITADTETTENEGGAE
jgi:hypothetical protein